MLLGLRRLAHESVQLGRRGLIDARLQLVAADRFEQTQHTGGVDVSGELRRVERHADVALRRQVVDLVGPRHRDDAVQAARVAEIAVVQVVHLLRRQTPWPGRPRCAAG